MKLHYLIILFVAVLIMGCGNSDNHFILSSEVVEIQFTRNIQDGDWFKLDELLFTHVINDTTDLDSQDPASHYDYFENESQEFVNKGYLPSSKLYYQVEGDRNIENVTEGRLAGLFVRRLYQKQAEMKDGDLIYQVGNAQYLFLNGRVFVKRSDDMPIRVTSNSKNRIQFYKLKKGDELYQKIFKL